MKKLSYLALLVLPVFIATSCKKLQTLPPEPRIEYRSFQVFDTIDILGNDAKGGKLTFYFEDGDGDVGMNPPTSELEDTSNLILTLYRKTGGVMTPAPANDPLMPSSYRIPYMEKTGQNKILKGTIDVTFLYLFYKSTDTIMYEFYIKDRALNESNTASTSEIILSKNNVY
ncbi:MAG TPA: hypothetical protein VK155_09345 [Bacteroidales bacterium]|jgi:hypothetical protein|nr:hypothetical protein [Bacteroidales bacterium]